MYFHQQLQSLNVPYHQFSIGGRILECILLLLTMKCDMNHIWLQKSNATILFLASILKGNYLLALCQELATKHFSRGSSGCFCKRIT